MSNEIDRRSVLRLGGLTVALGAVVAACGAGENGGTNGVGPEKVAQLGTAPEPAQAPSKDISDNRLLRTATSMHYNGIDAIDRVLALGVISYEAAGLARTYRGLLQQQADALAAATAANGGTPYTQKNSVIDKNIVTKAIDLINAGHRKGSDATRFLHAFATLAGETHQAFVPLLSQPALRGAAMQIGAVHHRVATLLARAINPANVVDVSSLGMEGPAPSELSEDASAGPVPVPQYQVPSAFGPLGAVSIVLGKFGVDDEMKRQQQNFETPSLNSLIPDEA